MNSHTSILALETSKKLAEEELEFLIADRAKVTVELRRSERELSLQHQQCVMLENAMQHSNTPPSSYRHGEIQGVRSIMHLLREETRKLTTKLRSLSSRVSETQKIISATKQSLREHQTDENEHAGGFGRLQMRTQLEQDSPSSIEQVLTSERSDERSQLLISLTERSETSRPPISSVMSQPYVFRSDGTETELKDGTDTEHIRTLKNEHKKLTSVVQEAIKNTENDQVIHYMDQWIIVSKDYYAFKFNTESQKHECISPKGEFIGYFCPEDFVILPVIPSFLQDKLQFKKFKPWPHMFALLGSCYQSGSFLTDTKNKEEYCRKALTDLKYYKNRLLNQLKEKQRKGVESLPAVDSYYDIRLTLKVIEDEEKHYKVELENFNTIDVTDVEVEDGYTTPKDQIKAEKTYGKLHLQKLTELGWINLTKSPIDLRSPVSSSRTVTVDLYRDNFPVPPSLVRFTSLASPPNKRKADEDEVAPNAPKKAKTKFTLTDAMLQVIQDIPKDFEKWLASKYNKDTRIKKDKMQEWCFEAHKDFFDYAMNRKGLLMLSNEEQNAYFEAIGKYILEDWIPNNTTEKVKERIKKEEEEEERLWKEADAEGLVIHPMKPKPNSWTCAHCKLGPPHDYQGHLQCIYDGFNGSPEAWELARTYKGPLVSSKCDFK